MSGKTNWSKLQQRGKLVRHNAREKKRGGVKEFLSFSLGHCEAIPALYFQRLVFSCNMKIQV